MARKVRDSNLDSRAGRSRLAARGKPYYRLIAPGLHIGYRKPQSGDGKWVVRHYQGEQRYAVSTIDGVADDHADADGSGVLNFAQAQERARAFAGRPAKLQSSTVGDVVTWYIAQRDDRESKRRGRKVRSDGALRLQRYVIGRAASGKRSEIKAARLAAISLNDLDDSDLEKWRAGLPNTLAATTKQRLINDLKAALNGAYEHHRKHLPSTLRDTIKYGLKARQSEDDAVGVRENQILADTQVSRIIRAAKEIDDEEDWDGDLYRLVLVLAATGPRFSQAARMRVRDCQRENQRLLIPRSRKGKGKKSLAHTTVPVERSVIEALAPAVAGRKEGAWLFERWRHRQAEGGGWERDQRGPWLSASEIIRPWSLIRKRANLPDVIPYALRHSSIVRGLRQGLPTRLVAALHDTSVEMIERHYSRWITDGLEELAAKAIVPLVPKDRAGKILPIRARGR